MHYAWREHVEAKRYFYNQDSIQIRILPVIVTRTIIIYIRELKLTRFFEN
jgi:hypothetical protein